MICSQSLYLWAFVEFPRNVLVIHYVILCGKVAYYVILYVFEALNRAFMLTRKFIKKESKADVIQGGCTK